MLYRFLHQFKIAHILDRNLITERSWLFRQLYRPLRQLNLTRTVSRKGVSLRIPIKDGMGFANFIHQYEPWLDALLPQLLPAQGGTFLDIGANTGQTLLKVVPHFDSVQYYAVEPNDYCLTYLRALIAANAFPHITLCPYALSDAPGRTTLLMRYPDDLLATTSPDFRKYTKYARRVVVEMRTGDKLVAQLGLSRLDLIKIDVEGGEARVIAGLRETLKALRPAILCEILPMATEDAAVTAFRQAQAAQLLADMAALDYQVANAITGQVVTSVAALSTSLESSNYLCLPSGHPLASRRSA